MNLKKNVIKLYTEIYTFSLFTLSIYSFILSFIATFFALEGKDLPVRRRMNLSGHLYHK